MHKFFASSLLSLTLAIGEKNFSTFVWLGFYLCVLFKLMLAKYIIRPAFIYFICLIPSLLSGEIVGIFLIAVLMHMLWIVKEYQCGLTWIEKVLAAYCKNTKMLVTQT
jgi:hypothetical protein